MYAQILSEVKRRKGRGEQQRFMIVCPYCLRRQSYKTHVPCVAGPSETGLTDQVGDREYENIWVCECETCPVRLTYPHTHIQQNSAGEGCSRMVLIRVGIRLYSPA